MQELRSEIIRISVAILIITFLLLGSVLTIGVLIFVCLLLVKLLNITGIRIEWVASVAANAIVLALYIFIGARLFNLLCFVLLDWIPEIISDWTLKRV